MRNIKRYITVRTPIFIKRDNKKRQSFINSKMFMKIAFMFVVSVFGLCILSVNIASTGEYHFAWDPHLNDQVVEFRIYYRTNSGLYNLKDFEPVLISNPNFNQTKPDWKLVLPDAAEEYCFTIKAVDDGGIESAPSNEIGMGTTCGQIVNAGNGDESPHVQNPPNDGGGGGGRCFILQGILHDRRWDSY
ncbi:MAG: hypothetical protein ACQ9MH_18725 [Nitrospinales bacterium]